MTKKDGECQIYTWMVKKGQKPWYIKEGEKSYLGGCPKRLIAMFHVRIFDLFTLKPNILAQDQTSFLSCSLQIHCSGYVGLDPSLFWAPSPFLALTILIGLIKNISPAHFYG